jgi:hypothetical protein
MRIPARASLQLGSVAYLAAVGGLLWWSHAPMLVGWNPRVVLTGSMLPVVRPGDVALIGPAQPPLPAGRILLVEDPSRESGTYLHRVVRHEGDGRLVTKGDANASEDHPAVDPERVEGQLRLLVPVVGRPVVWLHDRRYLPVGGSFVATWAALAFALGLREGRDGERDGERDGTAGAAFGSAFGAGEDDDVAGFDGRGFDGRGFDEWAGKVSTR